MVGRVHPDGNEAALADATEAIEQPRLLACTLKRRQQKRNEHRDDRNDDKQFDYQARHQENAYLAARGGAIQPVARYAAEDETGEAVEKMAFNMQDGEVSSVIKLQHGFIIMKRDGLVPADPAKSLDKEREEIQKVVIERKVKKMIPEVFKEMNERANAVLYLKKQNTIQDLKKDAIKTLQQTAYPAGTK